MKQFLPSTHILSSAIISIHYKRPLFKDMKHIRCAEDADTYLKQSINLQQIDLCEYFWVLLLTNANRLIGICEVASGTTLGVQTNPKCIFQSALLTNATAIIVAHNHPSGNLNISEKDIKETNKLKRLAETMDITLLDHIIITSESFTSLAQESMI